MTLQWPRDTPRTPAADRDRGPYSVTWARAVDDTIRELERVGADDVEIDRDTMRIVNGRRETDPGVVVRFRTRGKHYAMAMDAHTRSEANLRAIGLTLHDLRMAESRGVVRVESLLAQYEALPPHQDREAIAAANPHEVLGVTQDASPEDIEAAYKAAVKRAHPDKEGGSAEAFQRVQIARQHLLGRWAR